MQLCAVKFKFREMGIVFCRSIILVVIITALVGSSATLAHSVSKDKLRNYSQPGNATVKYIGVLLRYQIPLCMATFMTPKFLLTSCRCIGYTHKITGIFYKNLPEAFAVRPWQVSHNVTQPVVKCYYHELCGVDPNRIIIDLGVVQVAEAFDEKLVTPIGIPNLGMYNFKEYTHQLKLKETLCLTTSLNEYAGTMTPVILLHEDKCTMKPVCLNGHRGPDCTLRTLLSRQLCVTDSYDVSCFASAGAPLVCYDMLVGINGRHPFCESSFSPRLFIRIDYTFPWIESITCGK